MNDVTIPDGMEAHGINGKKYCGGDVVPAANLREKQADKLRAKFKKQEELRKAQEKADAKEKPTDEKVV